MLSPSASPAGFTPDDREIARWQEQIQVGNAYVNRSITGAVVRRQPFGGWKGSNVGQGPWPAGRTMCSNWAPGARSISPHGKRTSHQVVAAGLEHRQHLSGDD